MNKLSGPESPALEYIALGLLATIGGVLATPLAAGPSVLLALVATVLMLVKGKGTLQKYGQQTLTARNTLLAAFGAWFLAEMLSTVINNQHWPNLDYPLRFLLGIGVFWIVRYTTMRATGLFYYGIAASALAAISISSYQHLTLELVRALGWTNFPIYFGNLCVLLCLYAAIVLIAMKDRLAIHLRHSLAMAIPLLVSSAYLSMSRSSWLGLAGLLVLVDWRRVNLTSVIGGGLAIAVSLAITFTFVPELAISLRLTEGLQDIQKITGGDYRSSIGDRLQMWKAALLMFSSSPLIGIGSGYFQSEVVSLVTSGAVNLELDQGITVFNQAHSEVMDVLATKGLVGLAAYTALLIMPFRLFCKLSETSVAEAKVFAKLGQATVISFFMFGLTLATFKVQIYCAIYPLAIALFAALALNLSGSEKATPELEAREALHERA